MTNGVGYTVSTRFGYVSEPSMLKSTISVLTRHNRALVECRSLPAVQTTVSSCDDNWHGETLLLHTRCRCKRLDTATDFSNTDFCCNLHIVRNFLYYNILTRWRNVIVQCLSTSTDDNKVWILKDCMTEVCNAVIDIQTLSWVEK